ncbi:hypothetical protein FPV67DRAFT_1497207 [Lyophyllum atratum]|nr:hypothetical protein FPV67DRAFT_1497207 [Lyophyllum atratum]
MYRAPTPPILYDPIFFDDEDGHDWYYNGDAGGYVLKFGKNRSKKIHETSISYMHWCDRYFRNRSHPVLKANQNFINGLTEYARTNYGDFRVPFGRKHQGKKISECRDKQWLLWARSKEILREKYPVFFTAVEYWLDNPRHQGVKRDIGELLHRTEYEDDLDLENQNMDYENEEPTQSDLDFIDDDEDPAEIESDRMSEDTGLATNRQSDAEVEDDEDPAEIESDCMSEDIRLAPNRQSDAEVEEASATEDHSPSASRYSTPAPVPKRHKKKRRKSEGSSRRGDDFIVNDGDDNGSDDYEDPDSDLAVPTPARVTRASARKEKGTIASFDHSSTARRRGRERTASPESVGGVDVLMKSPSRPRFRRNVVQSSDDDDEPLFDPRTPRTPSKRLSITRSRSNSLDKQLPVATLTEYGFPTTRGLPKKAKRKIVESSSDADDESETEMQGVSAFNISPHLAKASWLARDRGNPSDLFDVGSPTCPSSPSHKPMSKATSREIVVSFDVESDKPGPSRHGSKEIHGDSPEKRARSSDEYEPAPASRGKRPCNMCIPYGTCSTARRLRSSCRHRRHATQEEKPSYRSVSW